MIRRLRFLTAAFTLTALLATLAGTGASAAPLAAPPPPTAPAQDNWLEAFFISVQQPAVFPEGMNDSSCRPNAANPHPVVLVNGTMENAYANWSRLSPQLSAEGQCVFGFNYGGAEGSPFQQLGNMRASALQLGAFITHVREVTGASKVDVVGHSQGGLLPLYYISVLGGDEFVDQMIGIEPASNGIGVYGLLDWLVGNPTTKPVIGLGLTAAVDFSQLSTLMDELFEAGQVQPNVSYTTVHSQFDGLITLAEAQLPPGPNVENLVIQDYCPNNYADHVTAVYDDSTLQLVRNVLANRDLDHNVGCRFVPPIIDKLGS